MEEQHAKEVEKLAKDNLALYHIITTLLLRADELLDSRPWRLGRIVARIERPFRKLVLGDRRRFRHLTRAYFHDVAAKVPAFRSSRYPVTGAYDDVPITNVSGSVRETLMSLWTAVGAQLRDPR